MSVQKPFVYEGREIKGVIFDLDGTLYSQKKMQLYMFFNILFYYILRPHLYKEIVVLYFFRKKRYEISGRKNIETLQYENISLFLNTSSFLVRKVVAMWIEEKPLHFILKCRYSFVFTLYTLLQNNNIQIAVVSDYPPEEKLKALGFSSEVTISSTDKDVDDFKPNPKGFILASKRLGLEASECLVIGDRTDKDGLAAKNAGMLFVKNSKKNIHQLLRLLNNNH